MKKLSYVLISLILVFSLTLLPCSAVSSSLHLTGNEWTVIAGTYDGLNEKGNPKYAPQKWTTSGGTSYVVILEYELPALDVNGDYTISFKYWHTCNSSSNSNDALSILFYDAAGTEVGETVLFAVSDRNTLIDINTTVSFKFPSGASSAKLVLASNSNVSTPVYCYDITITGYNVSQQIAEGFSQTQQEIDQLSDDINKGFDDLSNAGSDEPPLDTDLSVFQGAIDTMNGWLEQLDGFADTIEEAGESAHEYISKGTEIFSGFLSVAPTAVLALVAFGIVFIVVRKIVGR